MSRSLHKLPKTKKYLLVGIIFTVLTTAMSLFWLYLQMPVSDDRKTLGAYQLIKTWNFDTSPENWSTRLTRNTYIENGLFYIPFSQINNAPYLINNQVNSRMPYARKYLSLKMAVTNNPLDNTALSPTPVLLRKINLSYQLAGSSLWSKPVTFSGYIKPLFNEVNFRLPEVNSIMINAIRIEFTQGFDSKDIIRIDSIRLLNENTLVTPSRYPTYYYRVTPTRPPYNYRPSPTPVRYFYPSPTRSLYNYRPSPTTYYYRPTSTP